MKGIIKVTLLLLAATFIIPGFVPVEPENQITDSEKEGILRMREEEKMARDVYLTLGETYDLVPFDHISKSEQQHMDRMLGLIETFDLEDPVASTNDERGKFRNAELADLYTDLIAKGLESKVAALKTGARVEEIDIKDLVDLLAQTENSEITLVYENLLRASHNHLRAFTRHLSMEGESYEPVVLDKESYDAILNASQQGMHGNGNGNGNGNGKGHGKGNGNGNQHGRHGAQNGTGNGPNSNNGTCNGTCMKTGTGSQFQHGRNGSNQ